MLADSKVRTAKARPKTYKLADSNRLFLMVTPSGGKHWRWNYEYDGKYKTMALGAYPLVSLADARTKRDEAYALLCEGQDPNVAKRLKIEANIKAARQTFGRVAREWHANAKAQWATIHGHTAGRGLRCGRVRIPGRFGRGVAERCADQGDADQRRSPAAGPPSRLPPRRWLSSRIVSATGQTIRPKLTEPMMFIIGRVPLDLIADLPVCQNGEESRTA